MPVALSCTLNNTNTDPFLLLPLLLPSLALDAHSQQRAHALTHPRARVHAPKKCSVVKLQVFRATTLVHLFDTTDYSPNKGVQEKKTYFRYETENNIGKNFFIILKSVVNAKFFNFLLIILQHYLFKSFNFLSSFITAIK